MFCAGAACGFVRWGESVDVFGVVGGDMATEGGLGEKTFATRGTTERFFAAVDASHVDGNVGGGFGRFETSGDRTFEQFGGVDDGGFVLGGATGVPF